MKANELRIGNKLNVKTLDGEAVVMKCNANTIKECEVNESKFNATHTPIFLTEEILLKCGFDLINNEFYKSRNSELCLYWTVNKNKMIPECNGKRFVTGYDFKYLHQLQNLYFELTGEELKCKLTN